MVLASAPFATVALPLKLPSAPQSIANENAPLTSATALAGPVMCLVMTRLALPRVSVFATVALAGVPEIGAGCVMVGVPQA